MCKTLSRVHPVAHLGSLLGIAGLQEDIAQAVLDRLVQAWRLHVAHARLHLMRRPQHRLRAHTGAVRQVVYLRCRYPRNLEYLRELCTTACHSSPCIARVKTWPWQCLNSWWTQSIFMQDKSPCHSMHHLQHGLRTYMTPAVEGC